MPAIFHGGAFGIRIAAFITQGLVNRRIATAFRILVGLLAAIPSVVYGLSGI